MTIPGDEDSNRSASPVRLFDGAARSLLLSGHRDHLGSMLGDADAVEDDVDGGGIAHPRIDPHLVERAIRPLLAKILADKRRPVAIDGGDSLLGVFRSDAIRDQPAQLLVMVG